MGTSSFSPFLAREGFREGTEKQEEQIYYLSPTPLTAASISLIAACTEIFPGSLGPYGVIANIIRR